MSFSVFRLLPNYLLQPVLETFGLTYYGSSLVTWEKVIQNTEKVSRESEAEIYKMSTFSLKRNTHSWKWTA